MAGLRIGVNALYLIPGGVGGTEIYLRNLLEALGEIDSGDEFFVFANRETGMDIGPGRANFHVIPTGVRAAFRSGRIAWEQTGLPLRAARMRLDVLLNPGFTAPLLSPCPMVTVFHDLQHKRHPEYFRWFDLPFWRVLLWGAAHRSAIVLADSESTRTDLLRFYTLAGRRVRVVPLGVDPACFRIGRERGEPGDYLLAVSTLHPHKNLERLLEAFAGFRPRVPGYRLVIAGLRGFHTRRLEALRTELGLEDAVEFTGWILREDLYSLYRRAAAFIYPSTFEGFGLPVLEAMAAAIPTACSRIEPLATNAAGAAVLFDPNDCAGMLDAMVQLVSNRELKARLTVAGPRRAADFSWRRTAAATLEALREAAGRPTSASANVPGG